MTSNDASNASSTPKRGRGAGKPFVHGNKAARHRGGSRPAALLRLDAQAEGEAREVLKAVTTAAKAGDMTAAGLILARIWPARRGRPVTALPPLPDDAAGALGVVLAAVQAGTLSPEEGQAVAGLIRARAEAGEWLELDARLARLEEDRE